MRAFSSCTFINTVCQHMCLCTLHTDLIIRASACLANMMESPPEVEAPIQCVLYTFNNKIK